MEYYNKTKVEHLYLGVINDATFIYRLFSSKLKVSDHYTHGLTFTEDAIKPPYTKKENGKTIFNFTNYLIKHWNGSELHDPKDENNLIGLNETYINVLESKGRKLDSPQDVSDDLINFYLAAIWSLIHELKAHAIDDDGTHNPNGDHKKFGHSNNSVNANHTYGLTLEQIVLDPEVITKGSEAEALFNELIDLRNNNKEEIQKVIYESFGNKEK